MTLKTIPDIRKILYATDLSDNAIYAFRYAMSLANRYGGGITFLHVLEDISSFGNTLVTTILGEERWKELRKQNEQKVLDAIKERLKAFCEEAVRDLPECPFITDEIVVKIGNPAEEILKQVDESDCDLVVMGSHGQGLLEDAMMGSVSRRVIRRCKKPVLVIRLPGA